jgi:3-mercaptopropionate dioxygenase
MNLEEFCGRFNAFLKEQPGEDEFFRTGRQLVKELLRDGHWFGEILRKMISDSTYLENQPPSIFPNEIMLYRSPERLFSVLAYIWEPNTLCEIHDHSSWGLIGALHNLMKEVRYRRLDGGKAEGFAELKEMSSRIVKPGEVSLVFPLERGIHQTGSGADKYAVSLGVYGKSIRKGYILLYNPATRKAVRACPPKIFKQLLAVRALKSASNLWGDELAKSKSASLPEYLADEF